MYHAIFSRYIDINIDNILGTSQIPTMRSIAWCRYDSSCKYAPQVGVYQRVWRVCTYGSISKPETEASVYKITAESEPRIMLCLVGGMDTNWAQVDAREGKLRKICTCDMLFLAINEGTQGSREGRGVPANWFRGYELPKGRSLTR